MEKFDCREVVRRRQEMGVSRREFAKRLGVGITSVFRWEKGNFVPRRNRIINIVKILNCQMRDIFSPDQSDKRRASMAITSRKSGDVFYYKRMETRRIEMGISRKELADKMNVKVLTVYQWEIGKVVPRRERIVALAKILRCLPAYIFSNSNTATKTPTVKSGFNYEYVEQRRIELGITRKDLANRMGLNISAIYFWGVGKNSPRVSRITELAKILKCEVSEILI